MHWLGQSGLRHWQLQTSLHMLLHDASLAKRPHEQRGDLWAPRHKQQTNAKQDWHDSGSR